jgi:flagellar hook-associated protein 3 FlgL
MKISNRMLYDQVTRDISRNTEILFKLNGQISSGKRINTPSDDPLGLSSVLTNRTELNMFDQYSRSINYATGWLNRMESLVQDTDDLLARASELTVQQSSTTASAETRAGAAEEIKQIRSMLLSNANAKYGNKYIFSGTRTQTPPYLLVDAEKWGPDVSTLSATDPATPADGDRYINTATNSIRQYSAATSTWVDQTPAEGDAAIVSDQDKMFVFNEGQWKSAYQGNDSTFSLQIGRGSTVQTNIPGSSVFSNNTTTTGEGDATMTLLRLERALRSNDVAGIRAEITEIEESSIVLNNNLALIGSNINKLDHTKSVIDTARVDTKKSISNIEDLDYAEAITSLQNQQTIYQATLKSASMITGMSLVDYI